MIPRLRWQRQLSSLGIVLLLIYFASSFPLTIAVANKGLIEFLPADSGVTADAIVVLGRGDKLRKSRVEVAEQLWKAHRAPLIFASGAGDGSQILQQLGGKSIPPQALEGENCSRTTEENAQFTAIVLKPRGIKQIVLVTDPPHMLRSLLTFRGLGFTVIPHTSPLPTDLAANTKAIIVYREYMGLISYGLRGRFFHRSNKAENPQTAMKAGTLLELTSC
jgi:uncharacterized SAM-binding protein YcdF (DUF218 family)